jgi:hypothetical protein
MATLNSKVTAFLETHKNQSAAALALLDVVMDHTLETRDWTPMARLVMGVEVRMQRRMQQIIGKCLGGVSGMIDTKSEFGYRFKIGDNFAGTAERTEFKVLVLAKASIYGGDIETFLGLDSKAPAAWIAEKRIETLANKAFENGLTEDELLALVKHFYIKASASAAKADMEPAH